MEIEIRVDGKVVLAGQATVRGADNPFASGSRGFMLQTAEKPVIGGLKYQPNILFTELGSKPGGKTPPQVKAAPAKVA